MIYYIYIKLYKYAVYVTSIYAIRICESIRFNLQTNITNSKFSIMPTTQVFTHVTA